MKKIGTHPFPSQEGMVKLRVVGFYVLSCIAVLSLSKEYRLLPRLLVPHQPDSYRVYAAKRSSTKDSRHPRPKRRRTCGNSTPNLSFLGYAVGQSFSQFIGTTNSNM